MGHTGDGDRGPAPSRPRTRLLLGGVVGAAAVVAGAVAVLALTGRSAAPASSGSAVISAAEGGSIRLGTAVAVHFPRNALSSTVRVSVATVDAVYDQLRSYLSYEEGRIDPAKFRFEGCALERPGKYFCEHRATYGSFVDRVSFTVFDDGDGRLYVGGMSRTCSSPQFGSCP